MVAGLCATHIGGAILGGALAAKLVLLTGIPVAVPVDVMIAMAGAVHPVSAEYVVPVVIEYLQPFFKVNPQVEEYADPGAKSQDAEAAIRSTARARDEARRMALAANSIVAPFGDVVVGGSSQAVGSPANAARIAHELARGRITRVVVELAPELFVRRGINVPSILMGAVYGAHTGDSVMYGEVMGRLRDQDVAVAVLRVDEPHLQRVTIEATGSGAMVDALNQGGGRLIIRDARPSRAEALAAAKKLGIVVVSQEGCSIC
jgi:L-serine dehydratase